MAFKTLNDLNEEDIKVLIKIIDHVGVNGG